MPSLPGDVLTALKDSLENEVHAWAMTAAMEHSHEAEEGTPPVVVVMLSKTFQLRSQPLALILTITADFKDAALEVMRVFHGGTTFDTVDAPLLALLEGMAGPAMDAAADDLLAKLTPA